MEYAKLDTEKVNSASSNLDCLSTLEAVQLMNSLDQDVPIAVAKALPEIAAAVDKITAAFQTGGRLFYIGAGTSGRLGILDASECPPTFGVDSNMVIGIIAGGEKAVRHAVENAEDSFAMAKEDLKQYHFNTKDVVVAISASGCAPYCLGALSYAQAQGAGTIALSCVAESEMGKRSQISIQVIVGPEILTGSTRLRAGTATKLVLNMLTTLSMVKIGKVYKNLMVDMVPTNAKLRNRAVRIVQEATGVSAETAKEALQSCAGNVKAAIVALVTNASLEEAVAALHRNNNFVRKAIEDLHK